MQALRADLRRVEPPLQASDTEASASRLDAFPSEIDEPKLIDSSGRASSNGAGRDRARRLLIGAPALALLVGAVAVLWLRAPEVPVDTGSLRVETDVHGADVTVDGSYRGRTPLLLSLKAGDHRVLVQQGAVSRALPVSIAADTTVVHHISWAPAQAAPQTTGAIEITSDPLGLNVSVDGRPHGLTPVTVTDLPAGTHEVLVRRGSTTVRRVVQVEAGTRSSLMVTTAVQGVSSGWLNVSVAVPLQIYEGTELVGSSESARILVPSGTHTYDLVNTALGFRASETVEITAGQTVSLTVPLPRGTINVNAVPWAEVWVDGQPLGETPIGNVSWTIGSHDLVLRHPDLGERRVTATITTGEPARVAVDMRKPQ